MGSRGAEAEAIAGSNKEEKDEGFVSDQEVILRSSEVLRRIVSGMGNAAVEGLQHVMQLVTLTWGSPELRWWEQGTAMS